MYLNFSGSKTDAKTWFIDLDGVLAMHNQYKSGNDELIEGSREALSKISKKDIVIGISASGNTPYVIGGLLKCIQNEVSTGIITCNPNTKLKQKVNCCVELVVGPEFITGSTRMKAGTAQKMALNMITTSVMIKLGHVLDNKMVDMKLSNKKLKKRAIKIISNKFKINEVKAESLLNKYGSVRKVINKLK